MQVEIHPPASVTSPWGDQWYDLEITQVTFDLSHKIQDYNVTTKNKFTMAAFEHSASAMSLNGVLTSDSAIPGSTLEDKKENWIEAASAWWIFGSGKVKTACAQIKWRGWEQYIMIERLSVEKTAGEEEEYPYEMKILIHEGA